METQFDDDDGVNAVMKMESDADFRRRMRELQTEEAS